MRVLVTGASSLIGEGVARLLTSRGDHVVAFQRQRVQDLPDVEQVLGDVRDPEALASAAARCDGIVHLAAKVGVVGTGEEYESINVGGTNNVIAAARQHHIARLVHVSTPSVAHGGEPIIGDGATPALLGRRREWYAESKAVAELYALDAATDTLGVVAIRPHLVWGPGDTQLVGRIVDRARQGRLVLVGGGRAMVDTTYIDNAVDALVAALDAVAPGEVCSGRAYVIANGEPRPIRDLVGGICHAAGVDFTPREISLVAAKGAGSVLERAWAHVPARFRSGEDEPPFTRFVAEQLGTAHWFDPRPARDDLGWQPTVSIDEGLERLAVWFGENA
jgi:nucleoside-diphosphate-sugar epimerase